LVKLLHRRIKGDRKRMNVVAAVKGIDVNGAEFVIPRRDVEQVRREVGGNVIVLKHDGTHVQSKPGTDVTYGLFAV
jgi:hypothetical protein